ncbi:GMC oxidoreductase [Peribacillus kribbensis]|uniref:GMC oxidoreductase n=1 Tax=Peribacillus kribbensis TaxID=356658 RepID=UPI000402E8BE|nr:GMC oxidoreductase [Peribacillus kribbensis]
MGDTHGPVPSITYSPTKNTIKKKKQLIKLAADILLYSGAKTIIQSKWPPGMMIHIMSTMKIGFVVDQNCEAIQVNPLFIADNSVLPNGLGGTNPTLTTQGLATRTAEKIQKTAVYVPLFIMGKQDTIRTNPHNSVK